MKSFSVAQLRYQIKKLLKISGDVIERIPTKDDNIPTVVVKCVSIADAAYNFVRGDIDSIQEYVERFDVEKRTDGSFVGMFFVNLNKDNYQSENVPLGEERFALKINIPECDGFLIFIENKYDGSISRNATFYHSKGFNFKKLLEDAWDSYNGKIYITLGDRDSNWQKSNQFSIFQFPKTKIFGIAKARLEDMMARDKQYRKDGVPRAYLFIGLPGAGKTTFALKMVEHSNKVIKFDAKSLDNLSIESIDFLLSGLQPEYIVIDDIDKIFFGNTNATLLHTMEHIKLNHPQTTILLTANQIDKMDAALLRPGRIDEIVEFGCHDVIERLEIIRGYVKLFNRKISKKDIKRLVEVTSGLTAAYLKEAVIQLKYLSPDKLINNITKTKSLLGIEDEEEEKDSPICNGLKKKRKRYKAPLKKRPLVNLGAK